MYKQFSALQKETNCLNLGTTYWDWLVTYVNYKQTPCLTGIDYYFNMICKDQVHGYIFLYADGYEGTLCKDYTYLMEKKQSIQLIFNKQDISGLNSWDR